MLAAVISDIHDNLANLEIFLSWASTNNIEEIICCGDVCNDETLLFLAGRFSGKIYLISGNNPLFDEAVAENLENISYLGTLGTVEIGGHKIGLCHEPFFIKEVLASDNKIEVVFYGHTHKPWLEKKDNVWLINPGTLGGVFYNASFAIWDTEKNSFALKILDTLPKV